jgi:hypothetical protein
MNRVIGVRIESQKAPEYRVHIIDEGFSLRL